MAKLLTSIFLAVALVLVLVCAAEGTQNAETQGMSQGVPVESPVEQADAQVSADEKPPVIVKREDTNANTANTN